MGLQLFIILLIAGLILVGAEIFVPGGVLGIVGALALVGAIVAGYSSFGPTVGTYIAFAIVFLVGLSIYVWARFFPKTGLGKRMTIAKNLATSKATEHGLEELPGKSGVALSDLRPAGFARIEDRRIDVVTQGGMISKGTNVVVVEVEGNRVVVKSAEAPHDAATEKE